MCNWGTTRPVIVEVSADLSHTGHAIHKTVEIDSCIADLVGALSRGNIRMRSSCCGHGGDGEIVLQDGRVLVIKQGKENLMASTKSELTVRLTEMPIFKKLIAVAEAAKKRRVISANWLQERPSVVRERERVADVALDRALAALEKKEGNDGPKTNGLDKLREGGRP